MLFQSNYYFPDNTKYHRVGKYRSLGRYPRNYRKAMEQAIKDTDVYMGFGPDEEIGRFVLVSLSDSFENNQKIQEFWYRFEELFYGERKNHLDGEQMARLRDNPSGPLYEKPLTVNSIACNKNMEL